MLSSKIGDRPSKIAVYAPGMDVQPDYLDAVSGHIQVPLQTIVGLVRTDVRTTLITTKPREGRVYPPALSDVVAKILLTDASPTWPSTATPWARAVQQSVELVYQVNRRNYDLIHFFGQHKTFLLAAIVSRLSRNPVAITVMSPPPPMLAKYLKSSFGTVLRYYIGGLKTIVTTTHWLAEEWRKLLPKARIRVCRPGITKDIEDVWETRVRRPPSSPSVLFWRNANRNNGADLCVEVFRKLAVSEPQAAFHFAVRPSDELESELIEFASDKSNVFVHKYPYRDGPTLRELLKECTCCFFPFRTLSINPQMALLETLYSGCPIVASDVESIPEMSGLDRAEQCCVSLLDIDGYAEKLSALLTNPARAYEQGISDGHSVRKRWNWESYESALDEAYSEIFGLKGN